ncbi:hypothetical protein RQP54_10550 [Curvibacter sp. APW13]|uniref:hypothetical protein n=1 Tax=Curvibacter sp. APW13 TaxID=3077236 RepID=UPI0028DD64B2|nr:hypothetical protein [Curvibacter sp. APW13]MDT8991299.1 hypothetical protein [Curvibacter sp. APW13]
MKHRWIVLAASVWCMLASTGASAATLACPALAQARPVGACPSEEELRYTFTGYCSDDNKAYRGETDVCTDYQQYRALKNVALWESGDGNFDGYLSCSASPRERQKAKAQTMELVRQGKLTKLVCSYSNNQTLTHRTRAQCSVEVKDCGPEGSACRASCD